MGLEDQQSRYDRGLAVLAQVSGKAGDEEVAPLGDLGRIITEFGFGEIYTRKGLSLQEREFAAVAMLTTTGDEKQLRFHLHAALQLGVPPEKLEELIIHAALFAGFPVAINTLPLLRAAVDEFNSQQSK